MTRFLPVAALAVLLLAGCSTPAPDSGTLPSNGSGTGTETETDGAPEPGPEICDMQTEWTRVDTALTAENYADASMFVSAVFPVDSLEPEFLALRELIPAYAEVVETGDNSAIEAAADDLAEIDDIQLRLQGLFDEFCG